MKTFSVLIFSLSFLFISNAAFGFSIVGSPHDFSGTAWSGGEICRVCHIPHNANSGSVDVPLWNHSTTTQVFIPYTSPTMVAAVGQPDGSSKLCLGCHDGTVAIDSFGGKIGTSLVANKIGPDLLNGQGHWAHPISFVYDSNLAIADTRLNDPASTGSTLGGTVRKDLLFKDKVQCSSCHDVHNGKGISPLLRMDQTNLCLTCHNN